MSENDGTGGRDGEVYHLAEPAEQRIPFVVNSPHSGRDYAPAFLATSRLDAHAIRRSEDAWIDRLFADAVRLGAPVLAARLPRAFLDLNREPWELRPAHVRRPPARPRQHALRARRRRSRHDPARRGGGRSRSTATACRWPRPGGASRGCTGPTTSACAGSSPAPPCASATLCSSTAIPCRVTWVACWAVPRDRTSWWATATARPAPHRCRAPSWMPSPRAATA